ncbi:extracellular solute-binding protein [Cyanobium sp. WAJ14-Wanaka]|nr:extracellular solute-binding protein [Cyanobium sp. WAJ14-Wanaka]
MGLLLAGCGSPSSLVGANTISVLVEQRDQLDPQDRAISRQGLLKGIADFRSFNPNVQVKLSKVSSAQLDNRLQDLYARGLLPDLMILQTSTGGTSLLTFRQKNYIRAVTLTSNERREWRSKLLKPFEVANGYLALPIFAYPNLACFDTDKLARSPRSFDGLIKLGSSNVSMGMDADFRQLLWLLSGFGNHAFVEGKGTSRPGSVRAFLEWIRLASSQPGISFVEDKNILHNGLIKGNFAWIPCQSRSLPSLKKALGSRLGVGVMPTGPDVSPAPGLNLSIWAFGSQSSARQQYLAKDLALFGVNAIQQRNLALQMGTILPVNPYASLPSKAYTGLRVIEQSSTTEVPLSMASQERLARVAPELQKLLGQVISGYSLPAEVAPQFEELLKP